ncbi:MAG: hypothetical protein K0U84_14010 [Actinomycetia bacterium]|nr:hypothetical protein [Actinomycetes bacterium]
MRGLPDHYQAVWDSGATLAYPNVTTSGDLASRRIYASRVLIDGQFSNSTDGIWTNRSWWAYYETFCSSGNVRDLVDQNRAQAFVDDELREGEGAFGIEVDPAPLLYKVRIRFIHHGEDIGPTINAFNVTARVYPWLDGIKEEIER